MPLASPNIWTVAIAVVSAVLGAVIIPVLLHNAPSKPRFRGPSLSELSFREVTFSSGDLQMGGMLFEPEGVDSAPVVVVIHGSGTSRRDNGWYLAFAKHLRDSGIAMLLPDKRGSEKSEGDWRTANFEVLAGDTAAAIDFLRAESRYREAPLGVMGMSQGGSIAPVVAGDNANVAFVVSISGSAVTPPEQLRHEERNNLRDMGFLSPVARVIAPASAYSIRAVRQREFWQGIEDFDPIPHWQRVDAPVFVALGARDEYDNVPVAESVRRLTAVRDGGTAMTVKVYPESGHAIEDPNTNMLLPELQHDLVQFVRDAVAIH